MTYLFDTNICLCLINHEACFSECMRRRFLEFNNHDIRISSITCAELYHGIANSDAPANARKKLDLFLSPFEVIDFDEQSAIEYGKLQKQLEHKGATMGIFDGMLASQAISHDYTLISNVHSFELIPSLKLEFWA